jgi:hypothetical protein
MRRPALLAAVAAALVVVPSSAGWTWPVAGPVLQEFALGGNPYAGGQHRGIDIAAPAGAPVSAAASGTVTFAGTVGSNGKTVTIVTADGYAVTLTHLGSIVVARGAAVDEGDVVGTIGPSGTVQYAEPYVHLGVRLASDPNGYVDPLALLPPRGGVAPAAPAPPVQPPVQPPVEQAPAVPPAQPAAPPSPPPAEPEHAPIELPGPGVPLDEPVDVEPPVAEVPSVAEPAPAVETVPAAEPAGAVVEAESEVALPHLWPMLSPPAARAVDEPDELVREPYVPPAIDEPAVAAPQRAPWVATPRATVRPAALAERRAAPPAGTPHRPLVSAKPPLSPDAVSAGPAVVVVSPHPRQHHRGGLPWRLLTPLALLLAAPLALLARREAVRIIGRNDVLPDDTDLLRERDAEHRERVHDGGCGHPRPAQASARRGDVLPDRRRRALHAGVPRRAGAGSRPVRVPRADRGSMERAA